MPGNLVPTTWMTEMSAARLSALDGWAGGPPQLPSLRPSALASSARARTLASAQSRDRCLADNDPRRATSEPAIRWGRQRWTEAEHQQMLQDAGFVDPTIRDKGAYRFVSARKPSEPPSAAQAHRQLTA